MSSTRNLMQIATDEGFQARVKYYMFNAALAVVAEVNTTTAHATRVTYAQKILSESADVLAMSICVLNNATIAAEADSTQTQASSFSIPDSDINFAVNSCFNACAGVST